MADERWLKRASELCVKMPTDIWDGKGIVSYEGVRQVAAALVAAYREGLADDEKLRAAVVALRVLTGRLLRLANVPIEDGEDGGTDAEP